MRGFAAGLLVGAALGVGGMALFAPPTTGPGDAPGRDAAPLGDAPVLAPDEREMMRPGPAGPTASQSGASDPGASTPGAAGRGADRTPAPVTAADPDAAYQAALTLIRSQLREAKSEEPGSEMIAALLEDLRARLQGPDPRDARLAGRALARLAGYGKLRPEEIEALAGAYASLAAGNQARPLLAASVALGWARDAKLGQWLQDLPASEEPEIRATVVEALDESPSDAYRAFLLRLSKHERSPDVLAEAWSEDPVVVALTQAFAPKLIGAIEARIAEGDLPVLVRGRGIFAVALAGVHDALGAQSAIGNLAWAEKDAGLRAFANEALAAVKRGEANVQSLEGIWDRHRSSFGKP